MVHTGGRLRAETKLRAVGEGLQLATCDTMSGSDFCLIWAEIDFLVEGISLKK